MLKSKELYNQTEIKYFSFDLPFPFNDLTNNFVPFPSSSDRSFVSEKSIATLPLYTVDGLPQLCHLCQPRQWQWPDSRIVELAKGGGLVLVII